jgi:hypothetical protein
LSFSPEPGEIDWVPGSMLPHLVMLADLLVGGGDLPLGPAQAVDLLTGLLLNPDMLLVLLSAAGDFQADPVTVIALANRLAHNLMIEVWGLTEADLPQ